MRFPAEIERLMLEMQVESLERQLAADAAAWEANVAPCRAAVAASFSPSRDLAYLDRFIADQDMSPADANVQRVLCTAYAHGAFDMAEGRILPLDLD